MKFSCGLRIPVLLYVVLVFIFLFCACSGRTQILLPTEPEDSFEGEGFGETGTANAGEVCGQNGGIPAGQTGERPAEQTVTAEADRTGEAAARAAGQKTEPETEKPGTFLTVQVCGAVCSPGVYRLPGESRICDAVEAAGGLTGDALERYVNQAAFLEDGMQIYIPSALDEQLPEVAGGTGVAAGSAGIPAGSSGMSGGSVVTADGRININSATREQLMTLPGIGERRADAILSYRQLYGGFRSVEDIMNVDGIKEGSFARLKDRITVG